MTGDLSDMGNVGGLAGAENAALDGGIAETSSTLTSFSSLSGGHGDTAEVTGPTHTAGGLQSQHVASLQGPQSGAMEIPGVANDAMRPQMQVTVRESWDGPNGVEQRVYSNTDVMSVESSQVDRYSPPSNRFGDPPSFDPSQPPIAVPGVPLAHECSGLALGADCNDGKPSDWGNVVPDLNEDYSQVVLAADALIGPLLTDEPGSGVCDLPSTDVCVGELCAWRQCATGAKRVVESVEDSSRCPYGFRCTSWDAEVPPNCTGGVYDVNRSCTVCCNLGEVETGGPNPPPSGTSCSKSCGMRPICRWMHEGCCKARNPGGLRQLEQDTLGTHEPPYTVLIDPDAEKDCPTPAEDPDLSATCSDNLCPIDRSQGCPWNPQGC